MVHNDYKLDDDQQMDVSVHDVQATPDQILQIRKYLPEDCRHVDDGTVQRFFRATGGDLDLTLKRLESTTQWKNNTKPEKLVCAACAKDPRAHYMHVAAFDKLQRPVIYSCLEMASNKTFQDNQDHMIQTFEQTLKCMQPGVEQWVWLCDFHGFGLGDVSPKLAKSFLSISADNYPERLGMFVIVDAPALFGVLWKAVKKFVDPKTYKKIRFVDYDPEPKKGASELRTCLDEVFDTETAAWFIAEMAGNRAKKAASTKMYDVGAIHRSATTGSLPNAAGAAHDPRGSPALLKLFASQPDILEPQASATVMGKA